MSRTQSETYDVIVVGGGASGMMTALRAHERGLRVLLLEKNVELGKKLSRTGGGRCNITNAEFDTRTLLSHYGKAAKFLFSPFSQFGVQDTFDFFTSRGLPLVVEERKRAFPITQKAIDVTRLFVDALTKAKITICFNAPVTALLIESGDIVGVHTKNATYRGKSIVIATGGMSHADTGSTGEGLSWLSNLGHTVHPATPDIVPLTVKESWVKKLAGKSLSRMCITFGAGTKRLKKTGGLLFTHFGISGPLVLNSSREVKKMLEDGEVRVTIDLFPDMDSVALEKYLLAYFEEHKNKTVPNALKSVLPPGMVDVVLARMATPLMDCKVHSFSRDDRKELVRIVKALPLTITGTMGYDWAVVSDGGVDLREVHTKTMASKLYKNLYFTGDVLHINRPSGGYSLQLCWTTGWVAGSNV